MNDKLLRDNLKTIRKIIEEEKKKNKSITKDIEKFIETFFHRCDAQHLKTLGNEALISSAISCFKFVSSRGAKEARKIRVFNPTKKEHGWETERTVLECNLPDSPFILDSVINYLINESRILYEVIHPIFKFKRNEKGAITAVEDKTPNDKDNKDLESVIHIHLSHISDEKERKEMEDAIEDILDCVMYSVNDWRGMKKQAQDTIDRVSKIKIKSHRPEEVAESVEFLKWTVDNNFIFLGYREFNYPTNTEVEYNKKTELGLFRSKVNKRYDSKIKGIPYNRKVILDNPNIIEITKSSRKSVVHRPVHMDYIGIKKYDDKGQVIGEERFIGLFTSKVYFQSAHNIPIIRKKINNVIERSGFRHDSHNGKALAAVLESHPRDELLQSTEEELYEIGMGIVSLSEKPDTRLFIRRDRFSRYYSCIIFIPREFFTTHMRETIQHILEEELEGKTMDYYTQVTDSPLARVNVLVKNIPDGQASDYLHNMNSEFKNKKLDIEKIERRLVEKTNSWIDGLSQKLVAKFGEIEGERIFREYSKAFPDVYKDSYHPGGATLDISKIEEAYHQTGMSVYFDLYKLEKDDSSHYQLKLYSLGDRVTLSEIMPTIENLGFSAIDEVSFNIKPRNKAVGVWLHHFKLNLNSSNLENKSRKEIDIKTVKTFFEDTLLQLWSKKIENDSLNQLVSRAGMSPREINLIRAYVKYVIQLTFPYSKEGIARALCKHPAITAEIAKLFSNKFDPAINAKKRSDEIKHSLDTIKKMMDNVTNVVEDKILTQIIDTIKATLRTNYFQKDKNGNSKEYISFKLRSSEVPNMPKPKPYAEIFVYSNEVEGVHLRGGKVARGGLRWSDRHEDFRTEVLGLVKAQQVKNAVIVPVGSKGGFVVKHPKPNRDEYLEQGKDCYRTYLSGLLDITDNIVKGKVITPTDVVAHDESDPYLVVAADKGTATFSDIANGVAQSYGFWLDDAFASGGSAGYDHKKMGITAKGGWISVMRHFSEMGKDCQKEDFTCVGIGDMAGDVFGNGMLLSQKIQLVGAFNHMHIFVDPKPDSAKTFKERDRMFKLPKSSWMDYDQKLISKGGGIFERSAKSIKVSKEMAEVFDIDTDTITPDDLIRKMLMSRVELIWNGGIGTYVKASTESNDQVGDKSNDNLRIDGDQLRCKIVGEGGNLGLTQRARIEYAKNGGRINTDAIDNSAGVDCSDHEVNIKIAFKDAMDSKKISVKERNILLERMTDEVGKLVLNDNELQTLALTITENKKNSIIESSIKFIEFLEKEGRLDRNIEFLPANENLHSRNLAKQGLTRPEISVLLAYSKLYLFDDLINSHLADGEYFEKDLLEYFPVAMREKFKKEILNHQLKREIITTVISNRIVNRSGFTFYNRMKEETGMKGCDVARAYVIVSEVFDLERIFDEIEKSIKIVGVETAMALYGEVETLIEQSVIWFLRNCPHPLQTNELIAKYKPAINDIKKNFDQIISAQIKERRDSALAEYISKGVSKDLANAVASFEALASSTDIAMVSQKTKYPIKIIGQIYFELGNKFKINWLISSARELMNDSYWDNLAIKTLISSLFEDQMKLTEDVIKKGCDEKSCDLSIQKWMKGKEKSIARYESFIEYLVRHEKLTQSMITVALERVSGVLSLNK